jgi:hypothetical protein
MRKKIEPDLKQVEQWGASSLSFDHMSALLNCSTEELKAYCKKHPEFNRTLEKGKAVAISNCATVVLKAIQGSLFAPRTLCDKCGRGDFRDIEEAQLKVATEYLKRHAPNWIED